MSPDKELEFHLRELRYDLHALLGAVLALVPLVSVESAKELRRSFPGICAGIEHDYTVHGPSALDLARHSSSQPEDRALCADAELSLESDERWSRVDEPMTESRTVDDLLHEMGPEIAELSASLHEAASFVARAEALRSRAVEGDVRVDDLLEHVHVSLGEAMHQAFSAMRTATWLDRALDPEGWLADQEEQG